MSIEQAEQFKRDLTDKWVTVDKTIPELRRFDGMTGKVKTVNMNCRALVEFDGPADIGWYDIDPTFLTVVDGPAKKEKAAPAKSEAKKPAAKAAGGASPLDAIRKGGAGGAGGGGEAKKPATGGSPLDMIRKQAGAKPADEEAPAEEPAAEEAPAEEPAVAEEPAETSGGDDLSGLSPIEQIRRQGGPKG